MKRARPTARETLVLDWQFTPYTPALVVAFLLSVGLAGYAIHRLKNRQDAEKTIAAFVIMMVGVAVWSFGDAMQVTSTSLGAKVLWRTIAFVGHNVGPVAFLGFALLYAGHEQWVTRRTIGVLALEPLVVAAVVSPTNPAHGLMWPNFRVVEFSGFLILDRSFGPWYWVNAGYNFLLVAVAFALLARMVFGWGQRTYRRQAALLGAGVMLPFLANVAWITKTVPVDLTSAAFAGMGLLFAVAVFKFDLLSLLPVARDAVIDNMRDGVIVLNDRGEIVDLNPAVRDMLDLAEDAVGQPIEAVITNVEAFYGPDGTGGTMTVDRGGRTRHLEVSVSTIDQRGVDGQVILLHDVTMRHQLERRSRALVRNATDAILVMEPDGEVTYASPSTAAVIGYDPDDLVGQNALSMVHPEDMDRVITALEECLEAEGDEVSVVYRYQHGDGSWRWYDSRGRNLLHESAINGVVVHTRDITERKARERALERQNARLEEFGSVLSHDLRNPLNVAQGYLNMLDGVDSEDAEMIENSLDRMERIIDDLQVMARYGREVNEREPFELDAVAQEAWGYVETGQANLTIEVDTVIEADRNRVLRLFENLFRNAIEHVGPDVAVTVGGMPDGFYIADDGPGIPEDQRAKVFQSGHSTAAEGTGFGLAIVREIVESHGWEVRVTDARNGGARFEVSGISRPPRVAEPARPDGVE
ncbi:MAG: histidine kinase N-terminal 7TM domain-containing protein [Halobacteriales archaeon]|nr:histidine kinase N-terminal 7TM domain-containing protein [Halobacteriales archaeon]